MGGHQQQHHHRHQENEQHVNSSRHIYSSVGNVTISTTNNDLHPPSPCSVMNLNNEYYHNGSTEYDLISDTTNTAPNTSPPKENHSSINNNDISTMWLDIQRWQPPHLERMVLSIQEYRNLLAHVIVQSLHGPTPWRYYQGYHILAGLVLSTFLYNAYDDLTTMKVTAIATSDTIHFLRRWLGTSILFDIVRDDTLEPILQRLRMSVVPLYNYVIFMERSCHINHGMDTTTAEQLISDMDDDEHDIRMVAQCIPWIFTMFGSNSTGSTKSNATTTSSISNLHARIVDAVLASHPIYFPMYLCVTKLLQLRTEAQSSSSSFSICSSLDDEWELILTKTIDRMQQIPPHHLSDLSTWYYNYEHDASFEQAVAPVTTAHQQSRQLSTVVDDQVVRNETVTMMTSNSIQQQNTTIQNVTIWMHKKKLYSFVSTILHIINDLRIILMNLSYISSYIQQQSKILQYMWMVMDMIHWKYILLRYPRATIAMGLSCDQCRTHPINIVGRQNYRTTILTHQRVRYRIRSFCRRVRKYMFSATSYCITTNKHIPTK
jgi:hypothetical protein